MEITPRSIAAPAPEAHAATSKASAYPSVNASSDIRRLIPSPTIARIGQQNKRFAK
jgi:hypothetical protein